MEHIALFFKVLASQQFPELCHRLVWVKLRLPYSALASSDMSELVGEFTIEIVEREAGRLILEAVGYGRTEMAVDEQYFVDQGSSKALVFLDDCHTTAWSEAFGEKLSSDEVTARLRLVGRVLKGRYVPQEPVHLTRLQVTPTSF